ncbi:hypothetical protein G3N56_02310 [Desulfovibrio sulfodismutans]|uniref:Uncharacterized protein n=1 Tax=Desulfolutivibrio sulfodismutans TaxID=63561 RepID=A0A7K3NHB4_9BACT|nr:hypothetical protein [Desulfolutivibrio sulfodismutans]NDY55578.1 hypothetical protein [Desulfolutivibrio sulfodismutans]QLA11479.1 hypothetical protein GD606_03905 [Desulfolutivibrio sulfodismutans DSM 3696]
MINHNFTNQLLLVAVFIHQCFFNCNAVFANILYEYEIIQCVQDADGCSVRSSNNSGDVIIESFSQYSQLPLSLYKHKSKEYKTFDIHFVGEDTRILDDGSVHGVGLQEDTSGVSWRKPFRLSADGETNWVDVESEGVYKFIFCDGKVNALGTIAVYGYYPGYYNNDYYIYVILRDGAKNRFDSEASKKIIHITNNNTIVLSDGYIDFDTKTFNPFVITPVPGEEISSVYAHSASDNGVVVLTYVSAIGGLVCYEYGYYNIKTDTFKKGENSFNLAYASFLSVNNDFSFVGQSCPGYGCQAVLAKNDNFYYLDSLVEKRDNDFFDVAWTISDTGFIGGLTNSKKAFLAWPKNNFSGICPVYNLLLGE